MKRQAYLDLKDRQRKEIEDFPIAYAFNDEQLKEALKKLSVESTKECVSVFGHGDIVKKENAPKLVAMLKRHTNEVKEALKDPDFAQAAFLYEMDNHDNKQQEAEEKTDAVEVVFGADKWKTTLEHAIEKLCKGDAE